MKWLIAFVSIIINGISLNRARQACVTEADSAKSEAEHSHPTEM